jgi:hypothetical protein
MSKIRKKGNNNLPPLQKRIILCLAEHGPQTINETVNNMKPKGHYKPTWIAFKSLKAKGLIQKQGSKTYLGRKYPQFWLTEKGIVSALVNGANPKTLQTIMYEKLPAFSIENNDIIDFLCEYALTSKENLYEIYTALKILKKSNNRALAKEIYRIIMNNETVRKVFEESFSFLKRLEGVKP